MLFVSAFIFVSCCVAQNFVGKSKKVSVHIADIESSVGNPDIKGSDLAAALADALKERISVDYQMAESAGGSDLIISGDIVEYFYTENDPVDMITGWAGIAMDAVKKENYVRMTVDFVVRDTESDADLMVERIAATITDDEMTYGDSIVASRERIGKLFASKLSELIEEKE
jgi:hypothetical protein